MVAQYVARMLSWQGEAGEATAGGEPGWGSGHSAVWGAAEARLSLGTPVLLAAGHRVWPSPGGAGRRAGVLPAPRRRTQLLAEPAGRGEVGWRQAAVPFLTISEQEEGGRIASFPESAPEGTG